MTTIDYETLARDLITDERRRQVTDEGYTTGHDAEHGASVLHKAGMCYLGGSSTLWPWSEDSFKPRGWVRNLTRAGALALAALDVDPDFTSALYLHVEAVRRLAETLEEARAVLAAANGAQGEAVRASVDRFALYRAARETCTRQGIVLSRRDVAALAIGVDTAVDALHAAGWRPPRTVTAAEVESAALAGARAARGVTVGHPRDTDRIHVRAALTAVGIPVADDGTEG